MKDIIFKIIISFIFLYTIPLIYNYIMQNKTLDYAKEILIDYEIAFLKANVKNRALSLGKSEDEAEAMVKKLNTIFEQEKRKFYNYCKNNISNSHCSTNINYSFNYIFNPSRISITYKFDKETKKIYDDLYIVDYIDDKFTINCRDKSTLEMEHYIDSFNYKKGRIWINAFNECLYKNIRINKSDILEAKREYKIYNTKEFDNIIFYYNNNIKYYKK
ncbi:hypothetical protein [Campylobacter geochelonis]|uniref:Uncharacterized protein n=1 Tax=Campylobacter geochelonis TaxID=1780362 RepID=A0A128ELZ9_9BACT|nr:hypothetical protein [Campylobacter geochelonis]QKF71478.1 hypothetical protein CGEO_1178 [Campylobacter geochelonis]CZE49482.1 Uncharacterised protein [Campylobacter geochelonis]